MKEHIIISNDRTVIVPASVNKIGNQYEHNVNKVTFDCPRYADDEQTIDLSTMKIYINYIRPDKEPLSSLAENVIVDETDPTIIHFDFRITRNVTFAKGVLSCLVCIKSVNSEGIEEHHWNSDIFTKLTVGEGMENEEVISEENSDLITKLLLEVDTTKAEVNGFSDRIDSVDRKVGSLDLLSTEDKSSVVSAVNEVKENHDDLKSDLANSKKAIAELNDKKITKFYANNLGETTLNDSGKGKIQDMMLYGKSEQKQYSGKNLFSGEYVWGNITETMEDDVPYCAKTDYMEMSQSTTYTYSEINKGGLNTCTVFEYGANKEYITNTFFQKGLINGKLIFTFTTTENTKYIRTVATPQQGDKFPKDVMIEVGDTASDFEPYVGGIPSPNPDYPQEIKSVVNPVVKVYDADGTHTKTASLPYTLNAIPVSSGGNVTINGQQYIADYVDVENKQLVRMVGELDIMNVNFSSISKNQIGAYNLSIPIKTDSCQYCKCTHYHTFDPHTGIKNSFSVGLDGSFIRLNNSQGFTNVSEAKAYLQNEFSKGTPVTIYYPLKEPTVTDLTDEEVQEFIELATYYPTTNVIITSDQLDGFTTFNYPLSMANGWNLIKEQIGDTREYIYDMELQSAESYVNSEYAVTLTELGV